MKRITFARLAVLMLAVAGLALSGCGGDDNGGLSAADMARIDAADAAAAAAQAEAEALEEKLDELEAELEAVDTDDEDTSDLDAAIAALQMQIAALTEKTADPETPLAILGGTKSTASANDRAALAKKIAGQLNGRYDHDKDKSLLNLPDIDGSAATSNDALTRNIAHAAGAGIMSGDGTSKDRGFLKHSFTGGPTVDLTSPYDLATLKLTNLLEVNGVDLKGFTLKETDKVMMESGEFTENTAQFTDADTVADSHTMTTTLGADGSRSVVVRDNTGDTVFTDTITYVGGAKVVEYDEARGTAIALTGATLPARVVVLDGRVANAAGMVTRANGDTLTVLRGTVGTADGGVAATDTDYILTGTAGAAFDPADPTWVDGSILPAASQATAKAAYANAGAAYVIAQHNAKGYGAWLEDSFFAAYVMNAEDDAIISDPDSTVMKIAWGGRAYDSDPAGNLSGRGETAMWKGLMVGHDMDAEAATSGKMLKGNAMITARVGEATLADNQATRTPDIVDVSLTNIITADGTAVSRVADGIHWTNLDLEDGSFAKGSEVMGTFYDNGNEVVGEFDKEDILGVFGAMEYEMDDTMMAGN